MHIRALLLGSLALLPLSPSYAAPQAPSDSRPSSDRAIVVTGVVQRPDGKPIPMSDWHVAETDHVVVYSKGDVKELTRVARNLEKEHFLLSMLFNRVDEPDGTEKIRVTLIGDRVDFDHLRLKNVRWQEGPYPRDFTTSFYYDPREDGAVMAAPRDSQKIVFRRGVPLAFIDLAQIAGQGARAAPNTGMDSAPPEHIDALTLDNAGLKDAGEISSVISADSRLYSGYAQHYLLTYFPAAYPRWYLEGFGEIFASFDADKEGVIEYGQAPEHLRESFERWGRFPVKKILDGTYLQDKNSFPAFTPYQAWALVHLLFFDEQWKAPLHKYLAAVASGSAPDKAAHELGDLKKLQQQLVEYHGRKVPYEQLTYPAGRIEEPIVRQLREGEARLIRGRLQLGSRVADPEEKRDNWVSDIVGDAAKYSYEPEAQLLLAEAQCRTGDNQDCLDSADRALALAPGNASGLNWKGVALTHLALSAPAAEREAKLQEARSIIASSNHADPDAPQPLLSYYRSFADAGQTPPVIAIDGVQKVVETIPSAPSPRVLLGSALAERGDPQDARRILLPVAKGPFTTPEQATAQTILKALPKR